MQLNWKQAVSGFIDYLKLERSLAPNTIAAYQLDITKLQHYVEQYFPAVAPYQLERQHIESFIQFISSLEVATYTQARILSGTKTFCKFLCLQNCLEADPSKLVDAPKISRKLPEVLSVAEIDQLIQAIDHSKPDGVRNRAIIETLYSSGLRVSELTALKISDLYFDIGFLKVLGKGSKERFVPIGASAMKHIELYQNTIRNHLKIVAGNEQILFLNRRGKGLTRVMIL